MLCRRLCLALLACLALALPALADDWIAVKLRGSVEQLVDGAWVPLDRGEAVPDDRPVRTLANGRVEFQRGKQTILLGNDTQIRIEDRDGEDYTIVHEDGGNVEVDVEARDVQHFEVRTKFFAAVVKGTHFTVNADATGGTVDVARGLVAVEDTSTRHSTTVAVGQVAAIATGREIEVFGIGPLPAIYDPAGVPIPGTVGGAERAGRPSAGPKAGTGAAGDDLHLETVQIELGALRGADMPALQPRKPSESTWLPIGLVLTAGLVLGGLALLFRRVFG